MNFFLLDMENDLFMESGSFMVNDSFTERDSFMEKGSFMVNDLGKVNVSFMANDSFTVKFNKKQLINLHINH
jgi:hypothetical protein